MNNIEISPEARKSNAKYTTILKWLHNHTQLLEL